MGYRNDDAVMEARLKELRARRDEMRDTTRALAASVQELEQTLSDVRAWRWIPRVVAALGLAVVVGFPVCVHTQANEHVEARALRKLILEERSDEMEGLLREVELETAALRDNVKAQKPTSDPPTAAIFGELRYLDAHNEVDAWAIVGGAACAMDDRLLAEKAVPKVPSARGLELVSLCAPKLRLVVATEAQ